VCNHYLDRAGVVFRDSLTLEEWREFAGIKVIDELADIVNGHFLNISVKLEFADIFLTRLHDTHSGEVLSCHTDELCKLLLNPISDSGVREENLAFELLGCFSKLSLVGLLAFEE